MGFTREQLLAYAGTTVPDLVGPDCRLLFAGINPGLWTAATGAHFARPGNRFYPALYAAGITDHVIDASMGMREADREALIAAGVGITNVAPRATAKASELTPTELQDGGRALVSRVERIRPRVLAVLGITAYRSAFGSPRATVGLQPDPLGSTQVWVLPNPSGLNAHETIDTLAAAYRSAAAAAGVLTSL
ncbi:Uracil-DNA glycosylase superfamily OS=Tsukamurella paurometabola (strain ATCC 8368 / DSM / CCUG 35730 / CIP 100753 / JCM 10117 / KCTC 9821 / NBRC 16120/ NCIMB 702349 / NCTC 13040) OX=521096 GN=Tpau_3921 PE=4 SV=1 [Tsukamurella paurometabola]|uniref:Uracil-DNA glycosylase superfamily n=1 Tax=Tsukamurella paurometabola (strain ATCC 8368 / DSM 20162 / CCUG 35730 / CIP 100753 / JCM 10117 / KCTC 9821 / NBRC 16120 / NCIMB 702349 / NCTC 13040) TaxID=521096 RepID=D5UML9_TSUPD|nr:G/U mismatch-specific DNA glycosylase [Tsukamurella paurometabola]ADG80493.1 Uracil-DNA glycosylase superfamily [Tsukamurella paurometabola DSM 20162]SUP39850.1 G/U mismatch-specific DNA glycosylase [Tsukamurella paurometabola]